MSDINIETRHFIDGAYVASKSGETFKLVNPSTEKQFVSVPLAGEFEVNAAVAAAEVAFEQWKRKSGAEKSDALLKLAALFRANIKTFAKLEAQSMGVPVSVYPAYLAAAANALDHYAALARLSQGISSLNTPGHVNFTLKQPFGVVAGILPWNAPLSMFATKVGPAVAAGNAVVVKTSEKAPLTSTFAAALAIEAGFPKGLINVIHGDGSTGAMVCSHPKVRIEIRKISFTGSIGTGRRVAQAASATMKNVTLELGGKSPALVFADADLENAAESLALSIFRNSGQICAAQTRLYVERPVKEKFIELYREKWQGLVNHGDSLDEKTTQGPLVDQAQFDNVMRLVEIGKKEGKLRFGGERSGTTGYFVQPTLFTDVPADGTINTNEVFGPVTVLHEFDSEDEAIRLANNTEFGLASTVFTTNVNRAMRVAERLEAGSVNVNTYNFVALDMPFGGVKQSGIGRELGCDALDPYLETKSVFFKVSPN